MSAKSQDICPNELTTSTTTEVINQMRGVRTGNEKVKTRAPTCTWRCRWLWSQPITWGFNNSHQPEHLKLRGVDQPPSINIATFGEKISLFQDSLRQQSGGCSLVVTGV